MMRPKVGITVGQRKQSPLLVRLVAGVQCLLSTASPCLGTNETFLVTFYHDITLIRKRGELHLLRWIKVLIGTDLVCCDPRDLLNPNAPH
jgi:hypothetical protein